jgi:hypothetical protein
MCLEQAHRGNDVSAPEPTIPPRVKQQQQQQQQHMQNSEPIDISFDGVELRAVNPLQHPSEGA